VLKKNENLPEHVPDMIDYLLKVQDPATVGLRQILKKKRDGDLDYPLKTYALEELGNETTARKRIFNDGERRVLELEKTVVELQHTLTKKKEESEKARQEAYKAGLRDGVMRGEKNGYDKAKTDFDLKLNLIEQRLVTIIRTIEHARSEFLVAAHKDVLELAHLMAQKIINTQISIDGAIVLQVIKKALTYLADRNEYTIRVAPDDCATVTGKKEFWSSITDGLDRIKIQEDSRVEKGGCIVESPNGIIDARIPAQVEALKEVIASEWESLMTSEINRQKMISIQ
jgi:flagellar assembly protein FliH